MVNKFNILILVIFCYCLSCNNSRKINSNQVKFNSEKWKKDTLGYYGYRANALKLFNLMDKKQKYVLDLLGEPDFICVSDGETTFQYCYEYHNYKIDKYVYKPRDSCQKSFGLGSVYILTFNKNNKVVLESIRASGG